MNKDKLFLKLAASKIIFLILLFPITSEIFLRKYIVKNDNLYQRSKLFKIKRSKNTVWGDSAALTSIYFLDGFLNFGGDSDNYQEIEKKIKSYYSQIEQGKTIINLSLNAFAEYRDRPIRDEDLKLYFSEREPLFFIMVERFQKRLFKYYESLIKNKFNLPEDLVYRYNSDGSSSYYGNYKPPLVKDIDNYHKLYPKKEFVNDRNFNSFIKIIDFLKNKNIKICLITAPWNREFREKKIDMNKFIEVRNFYKNFAKAENITYLDFLEYPYPNNKFYDGTHLNKEGSILFTSMVKKSCKF